MEEGMGTWLATSLTALRFILIRNPERKFHKSHTKQMQCSNLQSIFLFPKQTWLLPNCPFTLWESKIVKGAIEPFPPGYWMEFYTENPGMVSGKPCFREEWGVGIYSQKVGLKMIWFRLDFPFHHCQKLFFPHQLQLPLRFKFFQVLF